MGDILAKVQYFFYIHPRLTWWLSTFAYPLLIFFHFCCREKRRPTDYDPPVFDAAKRDRMSVIRFKRQARSTKNRRGSLSTHCHPPKTFLSSLRPKRQALSQSQSPLFCKLPPEIRVVIFEMVLCESGRMHVTITDGADDLVAYLKSHLCTSSSVVPQCHFGCYNVRPQSQPKLLSLLKSCRLAYSEGIDLLYSRNAFAFRDTEQFIVFANTIPLSRLNQIKHISIDCCSFEKRFPQAFQQSNPAFEYSPLQRVPAIISTMKKLESLYLSFRLYGSHENNYQSSVGPYAVRAAERWFLPLVDKGVKCKIYFYVDIGFHHLNNTKLTYDPEAQVTVMFGRWPLRTAILLEPSE
ncbi:uncharacterized protein BDR25DRAFT_306348 [Lindgomyces ingoldianus]|uniref:Uncharacterized protein n=1 Tax=Lindgomyces ingoldianus TaxID=673940 RepID=A0ACB6QIQ4_9PLEO|nr:uncharacterized protein BDR25DRAFT_306348 [Lindgomyces ingoldianus]KAF2466197.1 hypothetical protein BDR25DRAFT_306348 [Lindgomyces ingoldianus]